MTSQPHKSPFKDSPGPELAESVDLVAAIRLLLPAGAQISDAERFITYAGENQIRLDWVWIIRKEDGRPGSSLLAVPSAGRTVMLFTSEAESEDQHNRVQRLLNHGLRFLESQDLHLAQSLLLVSDTSGQSVFESSDFTELAILQYMDLVLPKRIRTVDMPDELVIRTYEDSLHSDLVRALDCSYVDTLDCPALRGLRSTDDVITGHQAIGHFDPGLWSIAYRANQAVGAVLINPSTKPSQAELVYIGIGPDARGKGWGRTLLQHGIRMAAERKLGTLSLAVDIANSPALKLYDSLGFVPTGRRRAVIRSIRGMQES
tara:strand:- start:21037 stop:21987 length:951 start_codon:yes stop_codon:yes gene_type:complete